MITCPVCQHSNAEGVMFCEKCGHEFGSEPEAVSPILITPSINDLESQLLRDPAEGNLTESMGYAPVLLSTPSSFTKAKLTAKSIDAPIKEWTLEESPLIVGKFDPETGIVDIDLIRYPDADFISRNHAELAYTGSSWQVTDLNSSNGTYLKHKGQRPFRIFQPEKLNNGDQVSFANILFTFSLVTENHVTSTVE